MKPPRPVTMPEDLVVTTPEDLVVTMSNGDVSPRARALAAVRLAMSIYSSGEAPPEADPVARRMMRADCQAVEREGGRLVLCALRHMNPGDSTDRGIEGDLQDCKVLLMVLSSL